MFVIATLYAHVARCSTTVGQQLCFSCSFQWLYPPGFSGDCHRVVGLLVCGACHCHWQRGCVCMLHKAVLLKVFRALCRVAHNHQKQRLPSALTCAAASSQACRHQLPPLFTHTHVHTRARSYVTCVIPTCVSVCVTLCMLGPFSLLSNATHNCRHHSSLALCLPHCCHICFWLSLLAKALSQHCLCLSRCAVTPAPSRGVLCVAPCVLRTAAAVHVWRVCAACWHLGICVQVIGLLVVV